MTIEELLSPIQLFLQCETPQEWIDKAAKPENLSIILLDHLVCELKAAQTGMWLIRKYAVDKQSGQELLNWLEPYERFIYKKEGTLENLASKLKFSKSIVPKSNSPIGQDLIDKMVLLIKEELHHFYQVLEIMNARNIPYENISAGRYAKGMMKHVKTHEPETLMDKLICGAYIEARSCERFAKLAPNLDDELNKFYVSLLRSEARHYEDYLSLAQKVSNEDISDRVKFFGKVEAELILSDDKDFKFHSGNPIN
jgi:tRNA-(ms[2]io[6]A)-hydroxylase